MLETFLQDLRIGLRVLIKEKGFCALAVTVLALGICAVTTQYAIVNGVLLHAFEFRDADQLVDVRLADPKNFTESSFNSRVTNLDFTELRERQTSFSEFVGYLDGSTVNLTWNGQPKRLQGGYITHDFFRALGVAPVLGRDFLPEEDRPGVDKAVLLSDALWRSDFGADPKVLGKAVRVNGRAGTIVGVMPPKFSFPSTEQLWIPLNAEFPSRPRNDPNVNFIGIIARLKPGVSMDQAGAEMSAIAQQFAEANPETNKQFTLGLVRPLIRGLTGGNTRGTIFTLFGFCVGVLLIACVNVMNMQFARATLRGKELAIRSSLGATRARLLRQMLTESLLVASLGAVVGVGLAFWATDFLDAALRAQDHSLPSWIQFKIDPPVLAAVVVATMLSAVVSGFVPAWLSSRTNAADAMKDSGRGNTGRIVALLMKAMVVFQVVVTALLLIWALLQAQAVIRQQTIDQGYDTNAVLAARMGLMAGDYPGGTQRQLFYDRLLRELRATPQFEQVALTNRFRMIFSDNTPIEIEGRDYKSEDDRLVVETENITPGYFATLGVKLLDGRDFTDVDSDQREPVAIVNAKFARKFFGQESALGRRFRSIRANGANPGPWRKIVGIVGDVRMQGPFNAKSDGTGYYVPFSAIAVGPLADSSAAPQFGTVVVRPPGGQRPEALAVALRAVVAKIDPNLPLYHVGTPQSALAAQLGGNRVVATMFALFGGVAIVLASVGLYGVLSFSVNQRTQEFGIRMALGADARTLLTMILRQGGAQLATGLAIGLGLSLAAAFFLREPITEALLGLDPRDPRTFGGVGLLLTLVSFVAILVPARRATRVDPMTALRAE